MVKFGHERRGNGCAGGMNEELKCGAGQDITEGYFGPPRSQESDQFPAMEPGLVAVLEFVLGEGGNFHIGHFTMPVGKIKYGPRG